MRDLCPSAQCERQLSLEVQELARRSLQKVLHPLWKSVVSDLGSVWKFQLLGPQAELPGHCCDRQVRLPPNPAGSAFLPGMPAVTVGTKSVVPTTIPLSLSRGSQASLVGPGESGFSGGPQASFLRGETHDASEPTVPTGWNVTHSLPIQVHDSVSDTYGGLSFTLDSWPEICPVPCSTLAH